MTSKSNHWTRKELEIYILLLCAQADSKVDPGELEVIQSKTDAATFQKMSQEISSHDAKKSFKKIRKNLVYHHYSIQEIGDLRREMDQVFLADKEFVMKERIMNEVLQNIIY